MKRILPLTALALGLVAHAQADLISVGHFVAPDRPANSSPGAEVTWASGAGKLDTTDLIFLGRFGMGGSIAGDENPYGLLGDEILIDNFAGADDKSVDLWWDLTGTGFELWGVLLKDGAHGDTLFEATDDQRLMSNDWQTADFGATQGGISHVTIFGKVAPVGVPDGGLTLIVFGATMTIVGLVARKIRR